MKPEFEQYTAQIPAVADAAAGKETFWLNPGRKENGIQDITEITPEMVEDAGKRMDRFKPYLSKVFPETKAAGGRIESELRSIDGMKQFLEHQFSAGITGRLMLKMDSHLPVSGSVKARGGIYEVLKHAEDLARKAGKLFLTDDYAVLAEEEYRNFFSQYTVQVGSTGNLGMSIGIMNAAIGGKTIVHMSADAQQWKKELLRQKGVAVVEYADDYSAAVARGRQQSEQDENSYFVDDEKSKDLFLGYSIAGQRLKAQLEAQGIPVDEEHPLFVYIPCGIGGAPGGITYGLKLALGDHVHCFFTEPVNACCMLLGMATGLHNQVSVQDFGISGRTEADGLAVGRPSALVGKIMVPLLSGIATIQDERLYPLMKGLLHTEEIFIEPSSCAAFGVLIHPEFLQEYVKRERLEEKMGQATHIVWATGGNMVPESVRLEYLLRAE